MGIRGLFKMIKNDSVFDIIDLVEEAKNRGGIEILVDFHAVIRYFTDVIIKKIDTDYHYDYLSCPIGVYDMFTEAITDLQHGFADAGIQLVWVVDGPKGLDKLASDQKSETWSTRDKDDIALVNDILNACHSKSALPNLKSFTPIGSFELALWSLKNAGGEVISMLQGMSDDFIAYEFNRRKAFAVLTNDTDFVVFKDCVVIFEQLLSLKYQCDDMKIPFIDGGNPNKVFKKPASLLCPVIKQERILRWLQFTSQSQLIALSILTGNDNTKRFSDKLAHHLRITKYRNKSPYVNDVALYISKNSVTSENLENLPQMQKFMADYPDLKNSIQFCQDLYTLKRIEENLKQSIVLYDPSIIDDSLTGFLAKKLSEGEICKMVYSMHFGIVNDVVFPERPNERCPPILTLLLEIRKRVYPYLINENIREVLEWRSREEVNPVKVPVAHSSVKTNMLKSKADDGGYTLGKYGIDLFEEIMCHMETGPRYLVAMYGIEKAFICHVLRYFYMLTKERNLKLSKEEFRIIFVTVFYQYSRLKGLVLDKNIRKDLFLKMNICPTDRCLIIGTWFMSLYYTAKYFCGGAFNLTRDFPEASIVMNGPVFYGFYEHTMCDINTRTRHLEDSVIHSVERLDKEIMAMYSGEYNNITE